MISGQILRFPTDSLLCMRLDSLLQTESNLNPGSADLHRLRADLLFKYGHYEAALEEIFQVESLSGNRGEPALNMARSLVQIKRYELAQQFYAKILARSELQAAAPQALLGLAEAFEKSVLAEDVAEPLHYLYPGNLFFNTEFAQQVAPNSADLQHAFAIYDSLIANQPRGDLSSQALYRLADLRFRVVRDFDGAQNLYRKALQTTRDRELILACQKRIGEVLIARGDPLAAEKHFRTEAGRREGTHEEKVLLAYLVLAQFLAQDFDSLGVELSNLMPLLGPQHPLFNDVMEFDDFFKANFSETDESGKKAFGELARQLLLHQNKLSEQKGDTFLIQNTRALRVIRRFRLIQINLIRADAAALAEPFFSRENELADQVAFMLAEVADRRVHDWQQAARYYEIVLEKYPNSLLVDPARKRLRELQQKTAAKES
jgi:tetratricopeptide (TPR) repeat protein